MTPLLLGAVLAAGAGGFAHVQDQRAEASDSQEQAQALMAHRAAVVASSRSARRAALARPLTSTGAYASIDPRDVPAVPAAATTPRPADSAATRAVRAQLTQAVATLRATTAAHTTAATKATAAAGRLKAAGTPAAADAAERATATARRAELHAADAQRAAIYAVRRLLPEVDRQVAVDTTARIARENVAIAQGTLVRLADGSTAPAVPLGTKIPGNGHVLTEPVRTWITAALGDLYAAGHPRRPDDMWNLALIIYNESGGEPGSKNTYDVNAARGMPSFGLMQTIGPTFEKYALPGHDDPANPVHQIIAGARYSVAAYGSLADVPGVKSLRTGGPYLPY